MRSFLHTSRSSLQRWSIGSLLSRIGSTICVGMGMIELVDHSPIWIVRYPPKLTIEAYRDLLDEFRRQCQPGQKYALIIDFSSYNPVGASTSLRNQVTDVIREQMDFFEQFMLCEVRICPNPILRGILTVFDFVTNLPWPCSNASTGHVAELWARNQLAKANIAAPKGEVWSEPRIRRNA